MGKTIKVTYMKDECYPIYELDCDAHSACGTIGLSEEFIDEFMEVNDKFWTMQDIIDNAVHSLEKEKPRQKKRGE